MAEKILKRRLNPLLMISTLAALSLLAGVAVLSQDQISQRETDINSLSQERKDLKSKINRLESLSENRSVKIKNKDNQISKLEETIQNQNKSLIDEKDRVNQLKIQLKDQETQKAKLNETIQNLRNETISYKDQVNNLEDSLKLVCKSEFNKTKYEDAAEECDKW